MVNYDSNEIVDIIFVLDRFNYHIAKKLHWHPNAMQIKRILLREHTRIHRRNRKNNWTRYWSSLISSARNIKFESSYFD